MKLRYVVYPRYKRLPQDAWLVFRIHNRLKRYNEFVYVTPTVLHVHMAQQVFVSGRKMITSSPGVLLCQLSILDWCVHTTGKPRRDAKKKNEGLNT